MNMPVTSFKPDAENTRLLRDAFGRFATGVTIVTAMSEDGPVGITANSFSSVSLDPPMVLWSPSKTSRRFPYFDKAEHYAIHILAAEQDSLCWGFAKDAFALQNLPHEVNAEGVPVIANALARFECKRSAHFEGGDHKIILGEVLRAEMREGDALAFYAGKYGQFAQS
ncbi:flavin reductase family protein [Cognatishimia maritima]|uniref:NADH-FMN oxidoreductase RutF, flavin reductase (DIM6/NTAB) family n=1 Tax=Cognatishimia maritima TaxID=870908 RepID=A0A1M5W5I9_9RHOB|nr:flavin reductase family protein [Cognatishimia maritima]SHH82792.1 NADH-FMN oxidoreductase RutF, flavin reductase (DIM6/NTAB) family [Cognatishimia maritima]